MNQQTPLDTLIALHLDGELTHEQCDQLVELLRSSTEARECFWREVRLHHAVADLCDRHWGEVSLDAEPDWIAKYERERLQQAHTLSDGSITPQQMLSLAGYLLGKALTSRPAYKAYAIAATILVAVMLFLVFNPGDDGPATGPLAGQNPSADPQIDRPVVVAPSTVATLTGQHDAQWQTASGQIAPGVGTALAAGQRLNLVQGFAEITTARGAVAILEAPATIELTDSNNAIHLHTGKLVGICETDSSKGFVVKTPHMDITDLGTRFGVDATGYATEVHVFEGEVRAQRPDAPANASPITLTAGQSARTTADNRLVASIDFDAAPFAELLPGPMELTGTGHGLALGQADPDWSVIAINGKPIEVRDAFIVSKYRNQAFDPQADSHWLLIDPSIYPQDSGSVVRYTCRRSFVLPDGADPDRSQLVIRCIGDHILQAIRVNGQPIDFTPVKITSNEIDLNEFRSGNLNQGLNTIEIDITELLEGSGNVSGLRAEFRFETDRP